MWILAYAAHYKLSNKNLEFTIGSMAIVDKHYQRQEWPNLA
jgi:hypothetical protein